MERLMLNQQPQLQPQNPLKLIEEFCEDCKLRNMTEETIRRYRSSLRIFLNFLLKEKIAITGVDKHILKEFLRYVRFGRKVKHKTIENYFSALSTFYDYLTFEGLTASNPVLPFRKRYLRRYKNEPYDPPKRIPTVEEIGKLVNSILDPRDKAIVMLLAKTGMRRGELLRIDVEDINWEEYSITLKATPKRSNRTVFFDDECAVLLKRWLKVREKLNPKTKALFINYQSSRRTDRNTIYRAVAEHARRIGQNRLHPHTFRHFFTTYMVRAGMPREYVKELRGDKRKEAMDLYYRIDKEELRKAYLSLVPKFGVI